MVGGEVKRERERGHQQHLLQHHHHLHQEEDLHQERLHLHHLLHEAHDLKRDLHLPLHRHVRAPLRDTCHHVLALHVRAPTRDSCPRRPPLTVITVLGLGGDEATPSADWGGPSRWPLSVLPRPVRGEALVARDRTALHVGEARGEACCQ